jgi:hypothetical protein
VRFASFLGLGSVATAAEADVSRTSESIHQEVVLIGSRKRIYEALTDATKLTMVTSLGPVKNAAPAQIRHEVGGAFSLFGGRGRRSDRRGIRCECETRSTCHAIFSTRLNAAVAACHCDSAVASCVRPRASAHRPGSPTTAVDPFGPQSARLFHPAEGWVNRPSLLSIRYVL